MAKTTWMEPSTPDSDIDDPPKGGAIGVALDTAEIDILQTSISDNFAASEGGGIYLESGVLDLANVLVEGNTTYGEGGGLSLRHTDATLTNVTIAENSSYGSAAGLFNEGDPALPITVINSIIASNVNSCGVYEIGGSTPSFEYNDVWGNAGGEYCGTLADLTGQYGNISDDPLFVDAVGGDFTLDAGSPCVDAGDPDGAYNDVDGSRNDMGAYGGPCGGR